jgi:hypothetical protein
MYSLIHTNTNILVLIIDFFVCGTSRDVNSDQDPLGSEIICMLDLDSGQNKYFFPLKYVPYSNIQSRQLYK